VNDAPDASGIAGQLTALRALLASADVPDWPERDEDLAELALASERLERRFTLAVVGEFSSGKSYLLNALLERTRVDERGRIVGLLATDINPSTATITELEYAAEPSAEARYPSGRIERIPLDRLARFVAVGGSEPGALHDATADDDAAPSFVTVRVDSPFLARRFVVADTPGLASLNPAHRRATLAYLPRCDAVLYLIDTQQPFSEGDAAFLGIVGRYVRTIFIVQTKIDLWRGSEADGRAAWEHARERIAARAATHAPEAEVFAVSARDFAAGTLENDAALRERSGFPVLLAALDRSLERRARAARIAATRAVLEHALDATLQRLEREAHLLSTDEAELRATHARAEAVIVERERALVREADDVTRAGGVRERWIGTRGEALALELERSLGAAIDVADIERIRDRSRFHSLVDAVAAPILARFAAEVASDAARELERLARSRPGLRVADLAAARLGGEPGVGAWSRDLAAGLTSTLVLGALGGPTLSFVVAVAAEFAARPYGTYMKRELGADLRAHIAPAFAADVHAYVADTAKRIAAVYGDVAAKLERERADVRAGTLEPIARALALAGDEPARTAAVVRVANVRGRLAALAAAVRSLPAAIREERAERAAGAAENEAPFDGDAYRNGLRPERYRVVVLGALRRGKSSLIDALAETRVMHDDANEEARFPVHVRYGPVERAFALESEGVWREIESAAAAAQATRGPVLIEVPWNLPRELVLVHAPAFDSGNPNATEIALAAAREAGEVLALFSRQLSEDELGLYARVAEMGKPLLFAHTLADHETAAERRNVVELAGRNLRARNVRVERMFTVSALDYLEHLRGGAPAAAWNELGALRETLRAHAEEHMARSAERERRASRQSAQAERPSEAVSSRPNLRKALARLLGRE
jgi:hypothetical protein